MRAANAAEFDGGADSARGAAGEGRVGQFTAHDAPNGADDGVGFSADVSILSVCILYFLPSVDILDGQAYERRSLHLISFQIHLIFFRLRT